MKTTVRDFSYDQKETIKSFFTSEEWDAIDNALSEYQDFPEKEDLTRDSLSAICQLFASSY